MNVGDISESEAVEKAVLIALAEIPVVGNLLSGLAELFWPRDREDVWGKIKNQVEEAIGQAISTDAYNRVSAVLGDRDQESGLIGVILLYDRAVKSNSAQLDSYWISANTTFTDDSGQFQQRGIEALLLPLFAQMATLHLSLLRDGVLQGFCPIADFRQRVALYTLWANKHGPEATAIAFAKNPHNFNAVNRATRCIELSVVNVARLWQFLDPVLYPDAIDLETLPVSNEVFYTATEIVPWSDDWIRRNDWDDIKVGNFYSPPWFYKPTGSLGTAISTIEILSHGLAIGPGTINKPLGCSLSFDGGPLAYTGILIDGKIPSGIFYRTVPISPLNNDHPIERIYVVYSRSDYVASLDFKYTNGALALQTPGPGSEEVEFWIMAPPKYTLSSLWMPDRYGKFTSGGARDVICGFKQGKPENVTPPQQLTINSWTTSVPVSGSTNWIANYSVQYALVSNYQDGTTSNLSPWSNPISGTQAEPWITFPTPTTATSPKGSPFTNYTVWRMFAATLIPQMVGQSVAPQTSWQDTTL